MSKGKQHMPNNATDAQMTQLLQEAVKARFPYPEWVLLEEVANATGAAHERRADFFAINMYPSKGHTRICLELKASRNDLRRELADGAKSVSIGKYADEFYLVCPKGILDDSISIPETWGILEYSGGKLKQTKRPHAVKAEPMTVEFTAALLQALMRKVSCMEKSIDDMANKKAQDIAKSLAAEKCRLLEEKNRQMEKRQENLSQWIDALRTAYPRDTHDVLQGNQFGKPIEEIIKDDNLVRDVAEYLRWKQYKSGALGMHIASAEKLLAELKSVALDLPESGI